MNLMFVKKSITLPIYSLILYFLKKYNSFTIKKFGLFNGVKYLNLINHNNWISELKGKKLLILHPFKKSIEYQINKNNTLLPVV